MEQVMHRCTEEQGESELDGRAMASHGDQFEEASEGKMVQRVLHHESLREFAPGHEVQWLQVQHSPAGGIEGGPIPGPAHEGHAGGQVLDAEPLEDVNQAIHVHLLPSPPILHSC